MPKCQTSWEDSQSLCEEAKLWAGLVAFGFDFISFFFFFKKTCVKIIELENCYI